jgi:hypothetical protein
MMLRLQAARCGRRLSERGPRFVWLRGWLPCIGVLVREPWIDTAADGSKAGGGSRRGVVGIPCSPVPRQASIVESVADGAEHRGSSPAAGVATRSSAGGVAAPNMAVNRGRRPSRLAGKLEGI